MSGKELSSYLPHGDSPALNPPTLGRAAGDDRGVF